MPTYIEAEVELLEFIHQRGSVSFQEIFELQSRQKLLFGLNIGLADILWRHRSRGEIDYDIKEGVVNSRIQQQPTL
ncbi:hypothetical protein A3A66_02035 [Microgenomates group bacterium RIFCSPLOWO2_01_FULL_46_13]|nr:MAG: hypothetical protein A2783_01805 [Microgenomates group bacterium RIFCSPHIGHO2_01_FULL_45_11]OGV94757.1 MAG: hypothetical protein A3A66_02035 [Microgenomates group bacterium RIFCSPLOWO2_01_FULL_46_13]